MEVSGNAEDILVIGGGLSGLVAALAAEFSGTGAVQLFEAERSLSGAGGRAELHRSVASARSEEDPETLQRLSQLGVIIEETGKSTAVEILKSLTLAVQRSSKIQVRTSSPVIRLLHAGGSCYGCVSSTPKGEISVKGKVILCCGGFLADAKPRSILGMYRSDLLHWPIPFDFGRRHLHDLDLGHLVAPEQVQVFATAEAHGRRARRLLPRCLRDGGCLMSSRGEVPLADRSEEEIARHILRKGPCWLILWDFHPAAPRGSLRRLSLKDLAEEMKVSQGWLCQALKRRCSEGAIFLSFPDEDLFLWAAEVTPALLCCEGGLAIEGDTGAVLSHEDQPIAGLFAAGEAAAFSGGSLSSCVTSALNASSSAVAAAAVCIDGEVEAAENPSELPAFSPVAEEGANEPAQPGELRGRLALNRLEDFLEKHLTADLVQEALLRSLEDGNLSKVAKDLCCELTSLWGLPSGQALSLALRDPSHLPTRPMIAALPQAGRLNSEVSTSCVHCRLPLKLEVSAELMNGQPTEMPAVHANGVSEGHFAYATLLYGHGVEYFLGALVLGWSLQNKGCQEERLLLHTKDVPESFLDALQQYWKLQEVDYLHGDKSMYKNHEGSRFQDVFTKLQALSCTEYSKVLMMDLDMLVRGNLDELFHLRAPAALKRSSGREQPEHGGDFFAEDYYTRHADDMYGINAGVMLLEPNMDVYHRMLREIQDPRHPEHIKTFGPEQDYLGRFYGTFAWGAWTHLHARFNYQPNLPDDYVSTAHRNIDVLQDVVVAHYSGPKVKPWKIPNLELNVAGVRRLIEEDELRWLMGAEAARPNREGKVVMDGVEIRTRSSGLPENVQMLMWEWILALRQCNLDLLEAGMDLLTLIDAKNL
ncbi:unnamed protein product [Durusdinium trenchii]|uniref:FAD-dependent oxidoreductase 2 FAD-binding domain-containing protein n=1 Tax=Durusdinium trenchii TaxID=1381693 RepID=A0ABP0IRH3_9DINO